MNIKKLIIVPPLSSFENMLEIQDRKIRGAAFIPNKSKYINLYSLESSLKQVKFIDMVGIPVYCIQECILLKNNEIIQLP